MFGQQLHCVPHAWLNLGILIQEVPFTLPPCALTLISGMSDWLIHLRYIRIHVAGVCIHTGYHGGVCMYTQVIMVESVGDLVVAWLYG